jgi:hypothetical protein
MSAGRDEGLALYKPATDNAIGHPMASGGELFRIVTYTAAAVFPQMASNNGLTSAADFGLLNK